MNSPEKRAAKRSIFDQAGPESKRVSRFNQHLFLRSPPRSPESAPGSSPDASGSVFRGFQKRADNESTVSDLIVGDPRSLDFEGWIMEQMIDEPMPDIRAPNEQEVINSGSATSLKEVSQAIDKKQQVPHDYPNNAPSEPGQDYFIISEALRAESSIEHIRPSKVQWVCLNDGARLLKIPKVVDLEWARDYLSPICYGNIPVLTDPFIFNNVKFTPVIKPYPKPLDRYNSTLPSDDPENTWARPFLPGFPFPDRYPNSSLISLRHLQLRDHLATIATKQRAMEHSIATGRPKQEQSTNKQHTPGNIHAQQPINMQQKLQEYQVQQHAQIFAQMQNSLGTKNPLEDFQPHPQTQNSPPAPNMQEPPKDIQHSMSILLRSPKISADKNFAALHYPLPGPNPPLKIWGSLPPLKPSISNLPSPMKNPAHTAAQFLTQRAESATYAERQGQMAPDGTFTLRDWDEMGDDISVEMTQGEVNDAYHQALAAGLHTYDEMFRLNMLEIQHGPQCKYCKEHKLPYAKDPPDPTWMTRGEISVDGEEDWVEQFVDWEGGGRGVGVDEGEELDVDELMEEF